jgi:NhaA family Na+:H+ antiporter
VNTQARNEAAESEAASARFFHSEAIGSILLLIFTLGALIWANSPWSESYFRLLDTKIGISWRDSKFTLSWNHWINDGLMAFFFFVVGLEIKREIVVGHLSAWKSATLPVAAALGGMVVPAVIYAAINHGREGVRGWGIPMATDIAFALGVLALLGARVPTGLKVFLTALAIADDLGAVLVIALFYTDQISIGPLIAAGVLLALLALASWLKVGFMAVYAVLVAGVWLAVLASGIHATVAGILVAIVVPVRGRIQPKQFFAIARERLAHLEGSGFGEEGAELDPEQMESLWQLHQAISDVVPAGPAFERYLHPVTAYGILPLFALFNAGIVLDHRVVSGLSNTIGLGVLLGLALGKQAGIIAASWLVVRLGLSNLPAGVTWRQIHGAAILSGIGFTMALFISDLAIEDPQLRSLSKGAVLAASTICAACGYLFLRRALDPAVK